MNHVEYNIAVKDYSSNLFRYAFKWTRNEQDSKDLVQDVFGKLWEKRNDVTIEKAKSWLFTCMHNALVNLTKKVKTNRLDDLDYVEPTNYQPNLGLKDLLEHSFNTLSEIQKSIVLLRDSEGYSYEEIGQMLSLSEAQVKVYLFRARQKVKDNLIKLNVRVA